VTARECFKIRNVAPSIHSAKLGVYSSRAGILNLLVLYNHELDQIAFLSARLELKSLVPSGRLITPMQVEVYHNYPQRNVLLATSEQLSAQPEDLTGVQTRGTRGADA
jgi:hypothetical protein